MVLHPLKLRWRCSQLFVLNRTNVHVWAELFGNRVLFLQFEFEFLTAQDLFLGVEEVVPVCLLNVLRAVQVYLVLSSVLVREEEVIVNFKFLDPERTIAGLKIRKWIGAWW